MVLFWDIRMMGSRGIGVVGWRPPGMFLTPSARLIEG